MEGSLPGNHCDKRIRTSQICACNILFDPILSFRLHQIRSKKCFQQGDLLSALEFRETIQPLLSRLDPDVGVGFMDDFTLSGPFDTFACDIEKIASAASELVFFSTLQSVS